MMLKKYKSLPVVVRATLWFLLCSVLQKCISFITVPIFTRIMDQSQYGLYSTYVSILNVVTVICTMSFETCGFVNGITKEDESRHSTITLNFITLTTVVTATVAGIYLIFHKFINGLVGMTTPMMLFIFLEVVLQPTIRFWSYEQRFKYKYVPLVILTVLMTAANAGLGVLFVSLAKPNQQAIARVLSVISVQVLVSSVLFFRNVKKAKKLFVCENWLKNIKLHLPLLPHNLSMSLLYTSDRLMISSMIGLNAAAIYSVSYSAGMVVQTFKTCIVDAIRPWIYDKLKNNTTSEIKNTINAIMILVGGVSVMFSLCAPEVISILAPKEYYDAVYVIPPVACSSFFMFLYYLFVAVETYYEKTKSIMYASVISAATNIVLNAVFIPLFGYVAAGYTTLFSYVLLTFLHYRNVLKIEKNYMEGNHIFDTKTIIIFSVIIMILIVLTEFVYDSLLLRACFLFVLLLVAVIKHKEIKKLLTLLFKRKKIKD